MSDFDYKSIPALAAYIDRIGAEQLNFRRFMVKEHKGNYYTERALIRVLPDGEVVCNVKEYAPTKEEEAQIKGALMASSFPKAIEASSVNELLQANPRIKKKDLYLFRNRKSGGIIMCQERIGFDDGSKAYIPWTYFSDGEWRKMEPDGALPFWKPEEKRSDKIMVHEGAKAARHMDWLCYSDEPEAIAARSEHPWGAELRGYEHWGMIGGALAPHRADYAELSAEKPVEVVYVCDNDWPGRSAMQEVSRSFGMSMKGIMFDERFDYGFDLADAMPERLYKGGKWRGPHMSEMLVPATAATEQVPSKDSGKPRTVLRKAFREEWFHSVVPEAYIHRDWPNRIYTAQEFNNTVAPFSDVDDTSRLVKKDAAAKGSVLKYDPAHKPGIFADATSGRYINTHMPSHIKAMKGDPAPFIDFLTRLLPVDEDRAHMMKWVATLIAKPNVKMLYGCLLISEVQGVGKTTLGEKILAPLVGDDNVSYPNESDITDSNFNYWIAHKRLAIVNEIYAGQSSKAYNRLKSIITDRKITVSKKYQANYEIDNWMHVFACSNSMRALRLSEDDRRWFVPKVTDVVYPNEYWREFNRWLSEDDGLCIIKQWAMDYIEQHGHVRPGDISPWSSVKKEVIEEGLSEGQKIVANVLDRIREENTGKDLIVVDNDLVQLIKDKLYEGRHNDRLEKPATVRKIAKMRGWFICEQQTRVRSWGMENHGKLICSSRALAAKRPGELVEQGVERIDPRNLTSPM